MNADPRVPPAPTPDEANLPHYESGFDLGFCRCGEDWPHIVPTPEQTAALASIAERLTGFEAEAKRLDTVDADVIALHPAPTNIACAVCGGQWWQAVVVLAPDSDRAFG